MKRIFTLATLTLLIIGVYSFSVSAQQQGLRTLDEQIYSEVYTNVAPSVVSINVLVRQTNSGNTFLDGQLRPAGGTGFVYDTNGHLVTNAHVVDGAEDIEVYFFDGTIARAEIVGLDRDSDIAVIRVEDVPAERLRPVAFGNSEALVVGQATLAIGSPFGEDWTLTSGIVSALNRSIRSLGNFSTGAVIQTDTAINPGNSGGPLLNLNGEVIGVNTQIISETRTNSGIGFAVPSNLVSRVAQELIDNGRVAYSYMGINGGNMNLSLIESLNLPNNLQGAVVINVLPNSPAGQAGLRSQSQNTIDVITAVDGADINSMDDLLAYLAINTRPNQTVTLTLYRNGETINLPMTLAARPE